MTPTKLFTRLGEEITEESTICMSDEWHRFPSNFFLPSHIKIRFTRGNITTQLPQLFSDSTTEAGGRFNRKNMFESSSVISPSKCDYHITLSDSMDSNARICMIMIDSSTPAPCRWVYIPWYCEEKVKYKYLCAIPENGKDSMNK